MLTRTDDQVRVNGKGGKIQVNIEQKIANQFKPLSCNTNQLHNAGERQTGHPNQHPFLIIPPLGPQTEATSCLSSLPPPSLPCPAPPFLPLLSRPPNPPTAPAPLPPLRLFALRTAAPSSDPSAAPALRPPPPTPPPPPPSSPLCPALVPLPLRLLRPSKLTRGTTAPGARGLRGPGRGPPRRRRRWRCRCGERGGGEAELFCVGGVEGGWEGEGGKMRRVRGGYMVNFEAREYTFGHFFVVFRAKKNYFQRLLTWHDPPRQPNSTPDERGGYRAARQPVT